MRGQGDEKEARNLVAAALDQGVNLFDCANIYGLGDDRRQRGTSETVLGKALKGRRDDVVITSKVHSAVGSGPNDRGLSRYHILREVERSLQRLDTDRIDVYLMHGVDAPTPQEETLRALDALVQQGKIRYVGISNYQAWQVVQALRVQERLNAAPLITVQNPYNLLNRTLEREMFPMVAALGVGVMAYSPLAVGLLSGVYRPRLSAGGEYPVGRAAPARVSECGAGSGRGRGGGGHCSGRADRGHARPGLPGVGSLAPGGDLHHLRRGCGRPHRGHSRRGRPDIAG